MVELAPLLLIDKPKGISSFTVIRKLRYLTGVKKMGHAGTLDPLASGLVLIGVEGGTKLLKDLIGLDKEYVAEILIGEKRSTGDMGGEVLEERDYQGDINNNAILLALGKLEGLVELPVSAYSAIKIDGKPMYKRALAAKRKGELVEEVPIRIMKVYKAELIRIQETTTSRGKRLLLEIRFSVGSGTYIRSLGEELGRLLGYPATLANLRRTKVGEYCIKDARQINEFGTLYKRLLLKLRSFKKYFKFRR
jgi:tRNA pseudouridine55 synthase